MQPAEEGKISVGSQMYITAYGNGIDSWHKPLTLGGLKG